MSVSGEYSDRVLGLNDKLIEDIKKKADADRVTYNGLQKCEPDALASGKKMMAPLTKINRFGVGD